MAKTLKDVLPHQFMGVEYEDSEARKHADVEVTAEYGYSFTIDKWAGDVRWPGTHKYINYWVELANGKLVGFNENPNKGWSFPVMNKPKGMK